MRRALLLIVILLLSFGCIEEKSFPGTRNEQLLNKQEVDLDNDGVLDYIVYDYSPVTVSGAGMKVQRQVTVAVQTTGAYTAIDPGLTDVDLLIADQSLDEFSKSRQQSDAACSNNIGLLNVVCSDVTTCSRLCSGASVRCKKIAADYDEVLADSMISYVQANNEIRSLLLDARRMVLNLRETTDEERNVFLGKTRDMVSKVAEINANPLYTHSDISLCSHSDFGISYLLDAAARIGNYTTADSGYHYTVLLSAKPTQQTASEEPGIEVGGVGITDKIPKTAVPNGEQISSIQDLAASENGSSVEVRWNSKKPSKEGYLLAYEFTSSEAPESVLPSLKVPTVNVRTINLSGLVPTNFIFLALNGAINNYYLALGGALGLTIAGLLVIYTIAILIFTMVGEKAAGGSFTAGFRKTFGRTEVRWKTDIILGMLLLIGGVYFSVFVAVQPSTIPPILESVEVLLKNDMGIVGLVLVMMGTLMVYLSAENLTKIVILERAYGMVIKQEKDLFLARAATLKEKIKELGTLVEEYSKEEFNVSKEYDVLTSMRGERVDKLAKKMTAQTKTIVDEQLTRVENAISSLRERKKIADESWPKWRDNIAKLLEEQEEVYVSTLVTIPASLRSWALGRYAKEVGTENLTFDRDSLKRRKVTAENLVQETIKRGVIKGAVVLKHKKIEASEFTEGGNTVMRILALKLRAYAHALAKELGQHEPRTFAVVGGKDVILFMKGRTLESLIFMSRDKFKEAVEQWKNKMKVLEAS